ncbi:MAG: AAA family ATPase [Beijerinckiaceae bacterium]|nr:AAA family ATPase [Beijerinckiaceae bacterium]MCI0734726.1 AAA family ATPase [Beijerinckiaceae bacterium]
MGDLITAALGLIRRQFLVIILFALIGTTCGIIYLRITPPVYTAKAEILIDRGNRPVVQELSVLADPPFDTSFFESQVKILESAGIALSVVKTLDLTKDPEFVGPGGGLAGSIADYFSRFFQPESPSSESELEQRAAGAFLQRIEAKRIGLTFFIEINFRSSNPNRAAQIANAVADAYIADRIESKSETTRRANDWLRGRLDQLRRQASTDEQAVNSYKSDNKIVHVGGTPIGEQTLAALNSALVSARAKTSEALARLLRIEAVLRMDSPDAPGNGNVSDALNSPIITELRQEYLALVNVEADYAARFGKNHEAVIKVHNKIRNIQISISSELRRLAETSKSEYLIVKKRQEDIEQELALSVSQSQMTNRAQVTLRDLESAAHSSRSLHNLFQQRFMESTQQQSLLLSEVRLIEPATVANQKRTPKTIMILATSVLGGMILGGSLGLLREVMDRVFRNRKQVEEILHVPCVAMVPLQKEDPKGIRISSDQEFDTLPTGSRTITHRSTILRTVLDPPLSYFTESIRSIKLAADLSGKKGSETIVGITSSLPNEGKSTIAVALAQLVAQAGRRVIVVDCDLRNPSISRNLAPAATIGIIEVLAGENSICDAIWTDPATKMAFLPAVINSHLIDTSEILASAVTRKLFDQLRQSYDCVVIDLPPIIPAVDVRATAHLMDLYFLVVEWGRTKIDVVQHALNLANGVYDNLAGVVLNKTDMDYIGRYDAHICYYNNYYKKDMV